MSKLIKAQGKRIKVGSYWYVLDDNQNDSQEKKAVGSMTHSKETLGDNSTENKPKVFIERAEPLTKEGIKAICMTDEDYEKYCNDKKGDWNN